MNFSGKIALVTGGSGDIGLAACLGFARLGASVVVVNRNPDTGRAAVEHVRAQGGKAIFVRADVTRSTDVQAYVKAAIDAYGRIDCFFNNAGIEGRVMPIQSYDEAIFDAVIDVNLKGVFLGLRHVLPVMLRQNSGTVVNNASTGGLFGGPGMSAYAASKHGVIGLTKAAAADVARYGIRVNAVCAGPVETRMMRSLETQKNPDNPEAVRIATEAGIPTGRYSLSEEVANTVMFLCSELSANITGTHVVIDGGRSGTGGAVGPMRHGS